MKHITLAILILFIAAGCNKFDKSINTNTNLPSTASGTQLIANAQLSLPGLGSALQGEYNAQYLSETQYPGASLYPDGGTSFYGFYQGPLMNLQQVLNSTSLSTLDGPVVNQVAVAKILKAYFIWHVTDRWGDVPFVQALQGAADFTPAYDKQEAIYDSIFSLLGAANAEIVTGNINNDIVYGGDMNKWKRLANSIHLLAALRLSEVDPTTGAQEFNKALAAGVMTSNSDNLSYKHLADANNQNYWYGQIVNQNREWWALSETLVNYMLPVTDPRLPVYGRPATTGGGYRGLTFGTTTGLPNTTTISLLGTAIYAQNAPVHLVTYAQVLFAKAEAAKRGWITGGDVEAKANYDLAIEQSVRQWTGGTTGLAPFMASTTIQYNPVNALEQIAMQRYVHLFMHGYEGWAEWRRTGYPSNLVTPGGRAVPKRNSYPPNEVFNNAENYQKAVADQFGGTDGIYGSVWWDK